MILLLISAYFLLKFTVFTLVTCMSYSHFPLFYSFVEKVYHVGTHLGVYVHACSFGAGKH